MEFISTIDTRSFPRVVRKGWPKTICIYGEYTLPLWGSSSSMNAKKNKIINVQGKAITLIVANEEDYISLTDMAHKFGDGDLIENWLRNKNTVEYLGLWEKLNNPNFNSVEFDGIMKLTGLNRYKLSAKQWTQKTNATGLIAKTGRHGGTYAHKDIAFEFGAWLSPEFKLYLIREFQRLKELEHGKKEWDVRRLLTKVNYKIQTDSIKEILEPLSSLPTDKKWWLYADEADLLNIVLFNKTAKEWREENPSLASKDENIRDHASMEQLVILTNLESFNASFIREGLDKQERFKRLRKIAQDQMKSLLKVKITESKLL
jgi:KilA-N domain